MIKEMKKIQVVLFESGFQFLALSKLVLLGSWNLSVMPELLQIRSFCLLAIDVTRCSVHFAPGMQWSGHDFWTFGCYY